MFYTTTRKKIVKVFISYSRLEASETAKTIHNYLTEYGHHEVFIDTSDIRGGDEWWKTIRENISNCDIFIILVTQSALLRQYVKKEIELAKKLEKRIIPCIAKFVKYEDLQSDLTKYHGIRYENFDQLIQELGYLIDLEGKTGKTNNSSSLSDEELETESTIFLERAKGLEEIGQYSKALKAYDEALKINPNNFEAYYNKGLLHYKIGDFEKALEVLYKAGELNWKHKDVWYYSGKVLEKLERYDKALEAFNSDLHIDDKDIKSWISKGNVLLKLERYDDAINAIDEIIKIDSTNIDAFGQKGKILEKLKRYDEAVNCYDKVLTIDINNEEAIKNKNILEENLKKQRYSELISKIETLFYQQKDYSTVIDLCDKASDIDKENHISYLYKANSLLQLSRYEEAIRCYDKVLSIDANNKEAIKNKEIAEEAFRNEEIKSSSENKDYPKVIELFNGLKESVNNPILQIYKGDALYYLGNYKQSLQCYDKVLEIEPKNVYAFNKRRIVREQLYKQLTDSKAIKQVFEKAWSIEIMPRYVAVDYNGYVYVTSSEIKTITYRKFLREKQKYEYYNYVYKFDSDGKFITKWGSKGPGDGEFNYPEGISVDSSGNVYVADSFNHRIQKFDSNGKFIAKWGSKGTGDGEFNYPYGISVDSSSGTVYVADAVNRRIQKFDSNGKFIAKWGSKGTGDGEFDKPYGISVDSSRYCVCS